MRYALLFLIAVSFLGCRPAASPVAIGNKPVSVNGVKMKDAPGQPVKSFAEMSWTSFEGAVSKLKDHRGKAVVLDFWATNCPPCIEEIPHLLELKARYGSDLEIVGLHVGDDEDREKVPEFVSRLKITYPLAYPDDSLTSFIFETESAIPQTAIFDRSGKMVKKIVGFNQRIRKDLDDAVELAVRSEGSN